MPVEVVVMLLLLSRVDTASGALVRLVRHMRGIQSWDRDRARRIVEEEQFDRQLKVIAPLADAVVELIEAQKDTTAQLRPNGGSTLGDRVEAAVSEAKAARSTAQRVEARLSELADLTATNHQANTRRLDALERKVGA